MGDRDVGSRRGRNRAMGRRPVAWGLMAAALVLTASCGSDGVTADDPAGNGRTPPASSPPSVTVATSTTQPAPTQPAPTPPAPTPPAPTPPSTTIELVYPSVEGRVLEDPGPPPDTGVPPDLPTCPPTGP